MIKRLLLATATLIHLNAFAQCTDQVIATYAPQTVCAGRDVQLNASNVAGATYSWTGPQLFSSSQQNPVINSILLNAGGDYIVTATAGTCEYKDTVTILVNPSPIIPFLFSNGPICEGDTLIMQAQIVPAISYYCYWWGPDNFVALSLTGQDVNIYNASLAKAGAYKVVTEIPTTGCRADTAYLNVIVDTLLIPDLFISTQDSLYTGPMNQVTFTANVSNAGANPTYQWVKNSVDIPGATNATYTGITAIDFQHNDTIWVKVTADASAPCPQTSLSNRLRVRINLGVDDYYDAPYLALYPNPNSGRFTLTGLTKNRPSSVSILNAIGQAVYTKEITSATGSEYLDMPEVADGIYQLQIRSDNRTRYTRFNYQR